MAPPYQRSFSFTGFQANQPRAPQPGQRLDIEFDNIAGVLTGFGEAIATLRPLPARSLNVNLLNSVAYPQPVTIDAFKLVLGLDKLQPALGFVPENAARRGQANGYAPLGPDAKVPPANLDTSGLQPILGFVPENAARRGQPSGYAPLGTDGKVPFANLPDFGGGGSTGPITSSSITDSTPSGRAVLTGTPAQGRTALQLGAAALLAVGTAAGTVAAGDDLRFAQIGKVREFHVDDYGADPTGASASDTAFLACWNACKAAGGRFVFGGKGDVRYTFNAKLTLAFPTTQCGVTFEGSGQDNCVLYFPNGGGVEFQFNSNRNGLYAHRFTVMTGAAGVGEGLCLKNMYYGGGGFGRYSFNLIEQVTVTGSGIKPYNNTYWARGLSIRGTCYVNILNCFAFGGSTSGEDSAPLGIGMAVAGAPLLSGQAADQSYGVIYNFTGCTINSCDRGFLYDNFVQGVTIDACNFGYNRCAISTCTAAEEYVPPAGQSGSVLAQLYVTNSQVGANYGNVVEFLVPMFTASFVNFTCFIRANKYGLYLPKMVPIQVTSCLFNGDTYGQPAGTLIAPGTTGIYCGPSLIQGGSFVGVDFGGLGNALLLQCSGVHFDFMDFRNVAIPYADSGSKNTYGLHFFGYNNGGNLPPVVVSPRNGEANVGSRDLQLQSRRSNGTIALGKLYLDADGNLSIASTDGDGNALGAAILSILQPVLNVPGRIQTGGQMSVGTNLQVNQAANVGGSLVVAGATSLQNSLQVGSGFAMAGGTPVGKQSITGNITGDLNGVRNTVISLIAALLQFNMVNNNTN